MRNLKASIRRVVELWVARWRYWPPNMLVHSCMNSVLSRLPSLFTSNMSTVYRAISASKPSRSCRIDAISSGVNTPLPSVSSRSKQLAMSSFLHTPSNLSTLSTLPVLPGLYLSDFHWGVRVSTGYDWPSDYSGHGGCQIGKRRIVVQCNINILV